MTAPRTVIALYDNRPEYPEELSFKKGDVLELLDDFTDPEWWVCSAMGRKGIAPANRLKLVIPQVPQKLKRDVPASSNDGLHVVSASNPVGQGNYEEISDYDFPKNVRKSMAPNGVAQRREQLPEANYMNLDVAAMDVERLRLQEATNNRNPNCAQYDSSQLYQNLDAMCSSSDYSNLPVRQISPNSLSGTSPRPHVTKPMISPVVTKPADETDEALADYAKLPNSKPVNSSKPPPITITTTSTSQSSEYDRLPSRTPIASPNKPAAESSSTDAHDYQVPSGAMSVSTNSLSPSAGVQQRSGRSTSESEPPNLEVAYAHALIINMDTAVQRATALCEREFQYNATRLFGFVRAGWKTPANLARIAGDVRSLVVTLVRIINELERFADGVCANAVIAEDRRLSRELDRASNQLHAAAVDSASHREALDRLAAESVVSASPSNAVVWRIDNVFKNASLAAKFDAKLDAFVNSVRDAAIVVRTLYALVRGNARALFATGVIEKLRAHETAGLSINDSTNRHIRTRSDASRLLDADNYDLVVHNSEVEREHNFPPSNGAKPMRTDSRLVRSASSDALDVRVDGDRNRTRRTGAADSSRTRSTPHASTTHLGESGIESISVMESFAALCRMHDAVTKRIEQLTSCANQRDSPIVLVECTKQVVLVAYNLIYAGDSFRQQVETSLQHLQSQQSTSGRTERLCGILSALCAQLKTLLISAKQAALEFPNQERLLVLLEEAASVSRSANDLRAEATILAASCTKPGSGAFDVSIQ